MEFLAKKFIREIGQQELFPLMYNSAPLVQASGWTCEKYFKNFYKQYSPFPLIVSIKGKNGVMSIPITITRGFTREIFKKHWGGEKVLEKRLTYYKTRQKIASKIYDNLSYNKIEKSGYEYLIKEVGLTKNNVWRMNAAMLFSLSLDKESCWQYLKEVKSKISQKRFEYIWLASSKPLGNSFEIRRRMYILKLLANGAGWTVIAEKCQYFLANYHEVPDLKETRRLLKSEYRKFSSQQSAQIELSKLIKQIEVKRKKFELWLGGLTREEYKLAEFIQQLIDIRDRRKDEMAKSVVVIYRVANKFFREAGLPERLVPFYTLTEMDKGMGYLKKHRNEIIKREKGFTVYVSTKENYEFQYGQHEKNIALIKKFYLNQNKNILNNGNIIKGQSGSSGKARGRVKIVCNLALEKEKFKPGDILVTGMTRPEFVGLMRKAKAIITDEGGVTCHAAIISRELKIPCVIGTKIATQVLRDGDKVEVDADRGVVTKI